MSKFKDFWLKHWPAIVWPVVTGIILFGLPAIFPAIRTLISDFVKIPLELRLWFFILLCLLLPGLTILVIWIISIIQAAGEPEEPDWKRYTHDTIFGVPWQWQWVGRGTIDNLISLCPECSNQLDLKRPSDFRELSVFTEAYCDRCDHTMKLIFPRDKANQRIIKEIHRLIRTGEYKDKIS